MVTRLILFVGLVIGLSGGLYEASARDKDLRIRSEAGGGAEVGFCERPSPNAFNFPGHAFVTFSAPIENGRDFRAVGHTIGAGASAVSATFSYFGGASIAGRQMEERYTSVKQDCLVVKVNNSDYARALVASRPTLATLGIPEAVAASLERYTLGSNDCLTFAERVASALAPAGLKVPARTPIDTPATWIRKLIAANP